MPDNNTHKQIREQDEPTQPDLGAVIVVLFKGVLYADTDPQRWSQLLSLQNQVRDYVRIIGLELNLDEAEGYAFLRSRNPEQEGEEPVAGQELPRLIARRQLSFPVSLLLALLRKKLAEFDAGADDTRLVLSRDDIVELMRLFHPDSTNEAKLVDQLERHINKVTELGFLRRLRPAAGSGNTQPAYEVRRILKSFVDGQWLAEFDARLAQYQQYLQDKTAP